MKSVEPVIYTYLRKYQADPTSRVFAPLAELYRRSGLIDEAIEIAREGLKVHPGFHSGRVALARALFDRQDYLAVIEELGPIAQDIPENLIAQRLIADSSLMLGRLPEALAAYKTLLYFAPQDRETAQLVADLEEQAYRKGSLTLRTDPPANQIPGQVESGFEEMPAHRALSNDPLQKRGDWMKKIETLQTMLVRIDRYRERYSGRSQGQNRG